MKKSIFRVEPNFQEEVAGGFHKRVGIRWQVGNVDIEMDKLYKFYSLNMIKLLYSISNRQSRLFLALYALTRGGTCGVVVKSNILMRLSFVDKSHYWGYLRDLKRRGFIGFTEGRASVVIEYEDGSSEVQRGRIIWIEERGKVDQDPYSKEKAEEETERYSSKRSREEDALPPEIKGIIAYG